MVFGWWFREQLSLELVVLLESVNVVQCYKLSILVVRVSLAIFSRKNDNFSCIEDNGYL